VKTIRQQSNLSAKNAAAKMHLKSEQDPSISDGYLEDDPELLKIELQDSYNIMMLSRTKLLGYLSVLRRHVYPGNPGSELSQALDGMEEICSLLRPKYTVFSSPIPVDSATEANEEKTIKRNVEPPTSLDIQRSYNFEMNCRRNSEPPKSYEVPDDKYMNLATKKLANKKEVEMNVFNKGDDCAEVSDSCDLPSIDPLLERTESFEE
jgi:TBC1 domain family protein 5